MNSTPDRIATAIIDIIFTQPTPGDLRARIASLLRDPSRADPGDSYAHVRVA
jgi:hypothetical protein